ncbi:MAG: YraN family protein [Bryobacteraceae bacterium]
MLGLLYQFADRVRHRARQRSWSADLAAGRRGEDIAHRYLDRKGFTVVARNFRTRTGHAEIDLVAWDDETLVFVEVKARHSADYGPPDRAIGQEKERHLLQGALEFSRRIDVPWEHVRFDVVNVILSTPPAVMHIRDAFRPAAHVAYS